MLISCANELDLSIRGSEIL